MGLESPSPSDPNTVSNNPLTMSQSSASSSSTIAPGDLNHPRLFNINSWGTGVFPFVAISRIDRRTHKSIGDAEYPSNTKVSGLVLW